jgi:hypothetical protein
MPGPEPLLGLVRDHKHALHVGSPKAAKSVMSRDGHGMLGDGPLHVGHVLKSPHAYPSQLP